MKRHQFTATFDMQGIKHKTLRIFRKRSIFFRKCSGFQETVHSFDEMGLEGLFMQKAAQICQYYATIVHVQFTAIFSKFPSIIFLFFFVKYLVKILKKLNFYHLLSSGHCPSILGRPLGICPEEAVRGYATDNSFRTLVRFG